MRRLYVLLTRYQDNGAKAISMLTNYYYTHASLGFEDDMNTFYSFGYKGFRTERITKYLRLDKDPFPCQLFELTVSNAKYETIRLMVNEVNEHKEDYSYARIGVVLSLLRIPFRHKCHYFCSYFVADMLGRSGAVKLKKDASLYHPRDFLRLSNLTLILQGNLREYAYRYALTT